jgi:PAS domain S-box-containing protein
MALRESDLRQNLALSAGRMGVWDWNVSSGDLTWSAQQYALYGVSSDTFVPTYESFMAMVHPRDRVRLAADSREILAEGGPYASEFRIICPDGSERWLATRSDVVRDKAGLPIRLVGVNFDITDREKAEAARLLMINELNHRVKNTLATVQSMAAQSFRDVADPLRAKEAFTARLLALSRAHDVLTRESWVAAGLRDVVEQALAPFQALGRSRFSLLGPDVRLSSKEALAISMSLHELATNAAKYGALSGEAGTVALHWSVSGGQLRLSWTESGGPAVIPPTRRGFGSRLVERGLAEELDGAVELHFRPQGLVCLIEAPLQLMTSSVMPREDHAHVDPDL